MIVENKTHGLGQASTFEFKYIPNLDTTTTSKGLYVPGTSSSGVERRNLKAFVLASVLMGVVSYLGLRTTWGIVGGLRAWWWSS